MAVAAKALLEIPIDAGAGTENALGRPVASATAAPRQRVIQKGKLEVRAKPFATVSIDGRRLGEVEGVKSFTLNAGLHELIFAHPTKTKNETVEIKAGATATVSFDASAP